MLTLTTAQLKTLKQNNISIDPDKTKERTEQLWKPQKNKTKNDFLAFAGCSAPTVRRVYQTGAIHIKLAIAFGQVLNINPYYLTGEANEPGEFSDALLLQLLEQHGYKQLAEELAPPAPAEEEVVVKPKRKYTRKSKPIIEEEAPAAEPEAKAEPAPEPEPEVVAEPEPEPEVAAEPEPVAEPAPALAVDIDIPEEDLQALLHSLAILARAGIAGAQEKLAAVKGILVS